MILDGEFHIDEKRYEELIKLGYDAAKKKLDALEKKYEHSFDGLPSKLKQQLPPEELEEWRISLMAINTLKDKLN